MKVTQGELKQLEQLNIWVDGYVKKTLVITTQTKYGYGDIQVMVVETGEHKIVKVEDLKEIKPTPRD